MVSVTMKELLEAGVHFGHQTKRWNPKMKDYIFGQRNGIYIIDLQKTIRIFKDALQFIKSVAESGKEVLMVGTKKQAQDIIRDLSIKSESSYVNQRWLGGLLTNFNVIRGSVEKLIELDEMKEDGRWGLFSKKEQSKLEKVYRKLSKNLGGIKNMLELPGALFVIDSTKEEIAIYEARKLNIPIVAVVDTNGDPENIDHPIPGNDDAVRAIELFTSKISEAIIEGKKERMERELLEAKKEEEVTEEEEGTVPEEGEPAAEEEITPPVEEEVSQKEEEVPPEEEAPSSSKPSEKEEDKGDLKEPEKISLRKKDEMDITAEMVKELRHRTGIGVMECKKALKESKGDIEKAIVILRKKGHARAKDKMDRDTAEGIIGSYIHLNGKIGVLVELNCESDFVSRNDEFKELVKNIAIHVAASAPMYLSAEDIPPEVLEQEKEIIREQFKDSKKPPEIIEKIVQGKISKFQEEVCLLDQPYVKDDKVSVKELVTSHITKFGENIRIKRFARFELGKS